MAADFKVWDKVSVKVDDSNTEYAGIVVTYNSDDDEYGVSIPALGEVKVGSKVDLDIQSI
jgi:hypothetical protein